MTINKTEDLLRSKILSIKLICGFLIPNLRFKIYGDYIGDSSYITSCIFKFFNVSAFPSNTPSE